MTVLGVGLRVRRIWVGVTDVCRTCDEVRRGATGATQIEGKVTNIPKSRLDPQVRPYMAWVQPYLQVRAWTDSVGIGVSRVCSRSHAEEGSHPGEVRPNV